MRRPAPAAGRSRSGRQVPGEPRVVLREAGPGTERLLPDRAAEPLGQVDQRVPGRRVVRPGARRRAPGEWRASSSRGHLGDGPRPRRGARAGPSPARPGRAVGSTSAAQSSIGTTTSAGPRWYDGLVPGPADRGRHVLRPAPAGPAQTGYVPASRSSRPARNGSSARCRRSCWPTSTTSGARLTRAVASAPTALPSPAVVCSSDQRRPSGGRARARSPSRPPSPRAGRARTAGRRAGRPGTGPRSSRGCAKIVRMPQSRSVAARRVADRLRPARPDPADPVRQLGAPPGASTRPCLARWICANTCARSSANRGDDRVPSWSRSAGRSIATSSSTTVGEDDSTSTRCAEVDRLVDVVGDEQDRHAEPLPQRPDQVLQVGPGLRVDRGERLVHQQDLRLVRDRPGDRDPLLHPAGELPRIAPSGTSARPTASSASRTSSCAAPAAASSASAAARRCRRTVIHGNRLRPYSWNTTAMPGGGPCTAAHRPARPRRRSASSSPAMHLSSVVLPAPDGPTTQTSSPLPTAKVRSPDRLDRPAAPVVHLAQPADLEQRPASSGGSVAFIGAHRLVGLRRPRYQCRTRRSKSRSSTARAGTRAGRAAGCRSTCR